MSMPICKDCKYYVLLKCYRAGVSRSEHKSENSGCTRFTVRLKVMRPPIYDDIYYEGIKWLDENG